MTDDYEQKLGSDVPDEPDQDEDTDDQTEPDPVKIVVEDDNGEA